MSTDELLTDSLRALQESTDGSSPEAPRTRTQILAKAAQRTRGRRWAVFVVMPIAAALIASTAWGAVTGRLPHWIDMAIGGPAPSAPVPTEPPAPRLPGPATAAVPSAAPPVVTATVPEPDAPVVDVAPPIPAQRNLPPTPTARVLSTSTPIASDTPPTAATPEQSTYETAHQAHFVDRDPAAALRGWDAYLARYPDGRFAIEARYNRAISLVRLGRRSEAHEALDPFAEGKHGGYRQSEARGLLDAMTSADASTL
jgi:hypothetical protein